MASILFFSIGISIRGYNLNSIAHNSWISSRDILYILYIYDKTKHIPIESPMWFIQFMIIEHLNQGL